MISTRVGNEEVVEQLPSSLQALMRWERFNLYDAQRFQMTSVAPSFETGYLPQNCGAFSLPCFWVRRKHLHVYGEQSRSSIEIPLVRKGADAEELLLPIHPTALDHYRQVLEAVEARDARHDGLVIWALPTSSTRTLLIWPDGEPDKAMFAKTTLFSLIHGDRRLQRKLVARSVGLSRMVEESRTALPTGLDYFLEPIGFIPRKLPDGGVVFRSIPEGLRSGDFLVCPLFSLFGGDIDHRPLLPELLERTGLPPLEFIEDVLCAPFAKLWFEMSMRFGLLLEAHAQDLLLVMSPQMVPVGGFFYRDFEGLQVDWDLRASLQLPSPRDLPHSSAWFDTYATWGHPFSQLVSYKLRVSLWDYFYFVLGPLEAAVRKWQSDGTVGGPELKEHDASMALSRHLISTANQMFGVRLAPEFNVCCSIKHFVMILLGLRQTMIRQSRGRLAE